MGDRLAGLVQGHAPEGTQQRLDILGLQLDLDLALGP